MFLSTESAFMTLKKMDRICMRVGPRFTIESL
jgi:hypothetical protein